MVADHTPPWEPDRPWANAVIAFLGLAILGLILWRMNLEPRIPHAASARITAQARIRELQLSIHTLATPELRRFLPQEPVSKREALVLPLWDRALMAVLAAENGDVEQGRSLAAQGAIPEGSAGEAFRRCFSSAYLSQGDPPSSADRMAVRHALRDGYAARMLEARLQAQSDPASARKIRDEARTWALPRLAGLAAAGLAFIVLVPSGIVVAIVLAFSLKHPRRYPIPDIRLSGKALAVVFLSWLLTFLLSGLVIGSLVIRIPMLQTYALPLTYGFHALVGMGLLCWAERLTLRAFLARLMPGTHWKSLAWGFGFLAVAVVMVLTVSLLISPFIRQLEAPQRELMDLVAGTEGLLPTGMLFLTVSVLAPVFEECLFRGTLLPWFGHHLEGRLGRHPGWVSALLLTSLGFGMIHLQPVALPVLSTLGLALGLAFLHTRNLLSAILVHGMWNGGVFLFYRVVLG